MSTNIKDNGYLYFVSQPPSVTNARQGQQVTFQCQIRGQKPIGKKKKFGVFIPLHFMFKVYKNQTLSFQYFITSQPKTFTTFSFRQNNP